MRLGIIGSAGRRDDKPRMTGPLWENMLAKTMRVIDVVEATTLVSGGAAWSDHLAVALFLAGVVPELELHLPTRFLNSRFHPDEFGSTGGTANYYHKLMNDKLANNSLRQIQQAIDAGATVHVYGGFKQRNLRIGATSDYLLAFTFGTASGTYTAPDREYRDAALAGLKSGGTAHCWSNATSRIKEHVNLWELV